MGPNNAKTLPLLPLPATAIPAAAPTSAAIPAATPTSATVPADKCRYPFILLMQRKTVPIYLMPNCGRHWPWSTLGVCWASHDDLLLDSWRSLEAEHGSEPSAELVQLRWSPHPSFVMRA